MITVYMTVDNSYTNSIYIALKRRASSMKIIINNNSSSMTRFMNSEQ